MTPKECEEFVIKFLAIKDRRILKTDYNEVVGELLTAVLLAIPKHDDKISQLNTYLYRVCMNELIKFKKREKRFYEHYYPQMDMSIYKSNDYGPALKAQQEELKSAINKSLLPKQTKEVVLKYIDDPSCPQKEMAQALGMTRQGINFHLMSARQYLALREIEIG